MITEQCSQHWPWKLPPSFHTRHAKRNKLRLITDVCRFFFVIMLSNGRKCKCKTAKIKGDRHIKGAKVPGSEKAWVQKGQGANWPGSEKAREQKGQGAKVPGSELARVLLADSLRGVNWPWSEKARYRYLGVMLDSRLTMSHKSALRVDQHTTSFASSTLLFRALSVEARKTVVHAFVSSRLDDCNSLLFGFTDSLVQRLQAVQNAAAHLVSGTRRSEHITPVLRQLHRLPVWQCIEFKIAVLVYKALNGLSPQYLADDCQLITTTGCRRLRSCNVATCDVPRTRTTQGN